MLLHVGLMGALLPQAYARTSIYLHNHDAMSAAVCMHAPLQRIRVYI